MNFLDFVALMEQLFPVVMNAVKTVQQDTGKSPVQVIEDVINHLTPGAPNSPALT